MALPYKIVPLGINPELVKLANAAIEELAEEFHICEAENKEAEEYARIGMGSSTFIANDPDSMFREITWLRLFYYLRVSRHKRPNLANLEHINLKVEVCERGLKFYYKGHLIT